MLDGLIILLYIFAWIFMLVLYRHLDRQIDAGYIIILMYIVCAICSLILWHTPVEYYTFQPMQFAPFVYLFVMLVIALSPIIVMHANQIRTIIKPRLWILTCAELIIITSAIFTIPALIDNIQSGNISQLFSNADFGADLYNESINNASDVGKNITNIFAVVSNALADISILLFFYELSFQPKRRWLIIGTGIAILINTLAPIFQGQRGNVIIAFLTIIGAYFFFRPFYNKNTLKILRIFGIIVFTIITIPLVAITISRFKDYNGGAGDSVLYYVGQANLNFNNYGLDAGGIRHGDRTFNLINRVIDPNHTPVNFDERRDKYPDLKMDDNIFYTFVGDFTLDFGPWIAAVIIILFNIWILVKTRTVKENTLSFHQIVLLYLVVCIAMQGGFYLFAYSDTAGLRLLTILMLYLVLLIDYKYTPNYSKNQ